MRRPWPLVVLALFLPSRIAVSAGQAQEPMSRYDPATTDPATRDSVFPPRMVELELSSVGARLNGLIYLASGPDPHPLVVLLHGFPGNERNLDLAQALRRAGSHVLAFDYRGSWGSGGTFSFEHSLEDVAAALWFVRSDAGASRYRIDPSRIALVGHSMGGWLALTTLAMDSEVDCAAALEIWNVGADGEALRKDPGLDSLFLPYFDWVTRPGAPLVVPTPHALIDELRSHGGEWDVTSFAPRLGMRPLLLLSATGNEYHSRLVSALQAAGSRRLTALQWETDHSFSADRIRLAETLIGWLHRFCGF
jgi:pimeloyl-ACP methyl ester carboxylesterase